MALVLQQDRPSAAVSARESCPQLNPSRSLRTAEGYPRFPALLPCHFDRTCDSQNPYAHNAFAVTCYTPGFVCSADGMAGTCLRAASPGARARARRADTSMNGDMAAEKLAHQRLARNNVKASDLRERAAAAILRRRPTIAGTAAQDPTHVQARAP